MNEPANETASTRVCSSNTDVFANASGPRSDAQATDRGGLRDQLARQVGLAKRAVSADERKSNKLYTIYYYYYYY